MGHRLLAFCERFGEHFSSQTRSVENAAQQYVRGLFQGPQTQKNMERMEEVIPASDHQRLQHMLSASPWDERTVLDQVAGEADRLLGGHSDSGLLIDESGCPKKGRHSVGVARQWCGQRGKKENCQVGVFAALGRGDQTTLIDERLYLPAQWIDDPKRCRAAGVPDDQIVFKSKPELALELIAHARTQGVRFQWVGFDGFYGSNPALLRALDERDELFVGDVHKDQRVYLNDPNPRRPDPRSRRGRKPVRLQAQCPAIRVDGWADQQPPQAWQTLTLRDGTKGGLHVEILHQRVWLWDGEESHAHHWHLIVRRELDQPEKRKYSLSNAPADTSRARLAFMQGQRYWVERALQDGKQEVGLADYQVRGWRAWHHHMALVMMAMLFMLEERHLHHQTHPLLTGTDIRALLNQFLPRRDTSLEEVLRQMDQRHHKRLVAINSAHRKQRLKKVQKPDP